MKFNYEAPRDFAPQTLRALAKAATQFEERAREGNTIADSVRAAVVYDTREAKSGGEGFSIRMLASLCCQRLRVVVVLETVSVLMQAVVVFALGVVLEELELGGTLPWLGEDYAVVAVPFALFLIGRCVEQLARHRRRRLSEQVALALRSRLFHRALVSGGPLPAAASRVVAALTKRCRLRLVAPVLGSALSVALLVAATSVAATAGVSLVVLATAVEVILKRRVPKWGQAVGKLRCRREELSCAFLSDLKCASATVKCFGWEAAVFQRLGRLRVEEQRLQDRASRSNTTLLAVRSAASIWACLASLALHWLVVRPPALWECFQALAACRLLAQQLQQVLRILLTARPTAAAALGGSVKSPRPVPKQGTPALYKTSRFAVAVEGMRFFWPNLEGPKEASSLPSPPKPAGLTASVKAQKAGNGLSLVDSVTDDASVAERAKRSTHGSAGFDVKVLSLQVKRGSHIALVGAAGSGKSTLLAGLVGGCQAELWGEDLEETGILLSGRCAYAPQQPAVLSGSSIRDNVVFGSTWDAHRYEQVLAMSTLSEETQSQ
ncbi:cftr, partial [Symbiodinium necroappetens]